MNKTVEQTTKLLKELSILNKVEGHLLSDPESREEAYEGRKIRQQEIRQELVQLANVANHHLLWILAAPTIRG